jgi:hypothetical protein
MCACSISKPQLIYEAANGTPTEWLEKEFDAKPFINTINFYIENNPWSGDYQRALSIASNKVYLVVIDKQPNYQFYHYEIYFAECDGLKSSTQSLRDKLERYKQYPELSKKEAVMWLDGPTYTLESFGNEAFNQGPYQISSLRGYGNILDLAYGALEIAEKCASQLTSKGIGRSKAAPVL